MVLKPNQFVRLVCALWFASTTAWSQPTHHKTPTETERKIALNTYEKLRKVEAKLLASLSDSQKALTALSQKITQTRIDLSSGNQQVNDLETRRRNLEVELRPLTQRVRKRLKARQLSLKRGEAFLRLLVRREGPTSFLRAKGYLNEIAKLDLNLIAEYHQRRSALNENLARLEKSREVLALLESELATQAVKIDQLNESRYAMLEQAKQEKRNAEILARQLGLSTEAFYTGTVPTYYEGRFHQLTSPCAGKRYRAFGSYVDETYNTQHFNNGWSIEVEPSTPVHAIQKGKVLYSGWFEGYGQLVILQHSERFHSIYAHLDELNLSVDSIVERDEIIGRANSSSRRVYFEIRKDKVPVNPGLFITKERRPSR